MIHAALSEAVRRAVTDASDSADVREVVERARSALVEADGVSLFGMETDHPDLGTVHWIVGQPSEEEGYLVLAIASRAEEGEELPLFTAAADDLADAFRQVISDCGMPEAA